MEVAVAVGSQHFCRNCSRSQKLLQDCLLALRVAVHQARDVKKLSATCSRQKETILDLLAKNATLTTAKQRLITDKFDLFQQIERLSPKPSRNGESQTEAPGGTLSRSSSKSSLSIYPEKSLLPILTDCEPETSLTLQAVTFSVDSPTTGSEKENESQPSGPKRKKRPANPRTSVATAAKPKRARAGAKSLSVARLTPPPVDDLPAKTPSLTPQQVTTPALTRDVTGAQFPDPNVKQTELLSNRPINQKPIRRQTKPRVRAVKNVKLVQSPPNSKPSNDTVTLEPSNVDLSLNGCSVIPFEDGIPALPVAAVLEHGSSKTNTPPLKPKPAPRKARPPAHRAQGIKPVRKPAESERNDAVPLEPSKVDLPLAESVPMSIDDLLDLNDSVEEVRIAPLTNLPSQSVSPLPCYSVTHAPAAGGKPLDDEDEELIRLIRGEFSVGQLITSDFSDSEDD